MVHTTTIIPALGRQRQKDNEFGNSLGYIVRILEKMPRYKRREEQQLHNIPCSRTSSGVPGSQWYGTIMVSVHKVGKQKRERGAELEEVKMVRSRLT